MRNKKGSARDIVLVLLILFLFGFVTVVMNMVYDKYTDTIADKEAFNTTWNVNIESNAQSLLLNFDYMYIFVLAALGMMVIVSAFWIKTHPLFFFISVLLLVIVVILGSMLSNVFDTAVENPDLAASLTEYTLISFVMEHLPSIILLIGGILLVVLYAKNKLEE